MDWSTQEVLNSPNMSYTSRDFSSIYSDLISALTELTDVYAPSDEADPGIVLIKLVSMLGDMLSHSSDINALEVYPRTVLQLPNAKQIFRLVGYKMKWYRSAHCEAYFTNANSVPVSIGRFNPFTADNGVQYTNLDQIEIPAGASASTRVTADLIQGTPVTPSMLSSGNKPYYTGQWYDNYDYNVDAKSDVLSNRIYLNGATVDGTTITLVDDDSSAFAANEWTQVENLNTVTEIGKYFEFDFDAEGNPYIQLPSYWNSKYVITRFKLFYILSDGRAGEITDNALTTIGTVNVSSPGNDNVTQYMDNVKIYNTASTYGSSPETPDEGRKNAELWTNTVDTLIVVDDFTKAAKRITGVANAIATDKETDPDGVNMLGDTVKIYIIRKDGYTNGFTIYDEANREFNTITDDIWAQEVVEELERYKLATFYEIQPVFENSIDWIDWTIRGSLWLRQPVSRDRNHDILVQINNGLAATFSPSVLNFNEAINYIDVIDNIKAADKLIYHVDLDTAAIEYTRIKRDTHGNATGMTIMPKYKIFDKKTGNYTYYYSNGFGCYPAPGGDGTDSGVGFRILREDGATWISTGIDLGLENAVNELEIYNNVIYNWTGETRIDTGYRIVQDSYGVSWIKNTATGRMTDYYFDKILPIYLADGKESSEYLKEADGSGQLYEWDSRPIYQIWDSDYNQWTSKFIYRDTGEMCVVRAGKAYSLNRYCDVDHGSTDIVDGFGAPLLDDNENVIREPVAREELTGRYEQFIAPKAASEKEKADTGANYSRTYDFYLGQTHDGEELKDSIGHTIVGFPIRHDGLHIMIDTDRYIIHDNGSGVLVGSSGVLDGYGSIDYETGHVKFTLAVDIEKEITTDIEKALKIVYYKNVITMARYNQFDPDTFYIQPQFLRYKNANRSLG